MKSFLKLHILNPYHRTWLVLIICDLLFFLILLKTCQALDGPLIPTLTATPSCAVTNGPNAQSLATSVTISWTSNCAGYGKIQFGTSTNTLTATASDSQFTQNHTIVITDLQPKQHYFYVASVLDADGIVVAQSGIERFVTPALGSATPVASNGGGCKITGNPTAQTSGTSVTISWKSNCSGYGGVKLSPNTISFGQTFYDRQFVRNHTVVIMDLQPHQLYFYIASVLDEDGVIVAQSGVLSFQTP